MTTCSTCGKRNPAHGRSCLGCGAQLAPHGSATPAKAPVPNRSTDQQTNTASEPGQCEQCGTSNPALSRFCATCGNQLARGTMQGYQPPLKTQPAAIRQEPLSVFELTQLNPDGSKAGSVPLDAGTTVLGRASGGAFAKDAYLSPRHGSFTPKGARVIVRDEGSLNGIYRKLAPEQPLPLEPGQLFRIGRELIRFERLDPKPPDEHGVERMGAPLTGYVGRIAMVLGRRSTGAAFPIPESGLRLGRETGEVLFADDGYVSGLHCRVSHDRGTVLLTDLGSSNGTFVRIRGEVELGPGDILLLGQLVFRVTLTSR